MMRHIAHAAEAVLFGGATIVVIGSCVVHGLRAAGNPPSGPTAPNSTQKSASQGTGDTGQARAGELGLSEEFSA
jgi:hypothetical protein